MNVKLSIVNAKLEKGLQVKQLNKNIGFNRIRECIKNVRSTVGKM